MLRIIIGNESDPILTLDNNITVTAHVKKQVDPICAELAINTLEVVFRFSGFAQLYCPSDYPDGFMSSDGSLVYCMDSGTSLLSSLHYAERMTVYQDDKFIGVMFFKNAVRSGPNEYTINAQNISGILEDFTTPGLYLGSQQADISVWERFCELISQSTMPADIQSIVMGYLEPPLSRKTLNNGFIQAGTVRDAFRQLMFASGYCMSERETATRKYATFFQPAMNDDGIIQRDQTYTGGSVDFPETVGTIIVPEYSFSENPSNDDSSWTLLYDNTQGAYDGSAYDVIWDGLPVSQYKIDKTIYDQLPVFITALKNQTGRHKFFGKQVLASKIDRVATNPNAPDGITVSVDSLAVTALNSQAVLERLSAFYFSDRRVVRNSFVWSSEVEGSAYTLINSFDETQRGIMSDVDIELSVVPKATATFHTNWKPSTTDAFSNYVVLTGSGVWRKPPEVERIAVVLVGGGSGGSSGARGPNGKSKAAGRDGVRENPNGKDGQPGEGGNIHTVQIDNPEESYSYACGVGGSGGPRCDTENYHNPGRPGTDTTFGPYSSAMGARIPSGVQNLISGQPYGSTMPESYYKTPYQPYYVGSAYMYEEDGVGHGSGTGFIEYYKWKNGVRELLRSGYINAATTGSQWFDFSGDGFSGGALWFAGFPSGPAVGDSNGTIHPTLGTPSQWLVPGKIVLSGGGGTGTTPSVPGINPMDCGQCYGFGGGPGYGGGAGGHSGFMYSNEHPEVSRAGPGGQGGQGGEGGPGAPGCVVVYY